MQLLIPAILAGQLIKIPLFLQSGVIVLDIAVALLCIIGILKLKLKKPPIQVSLGILFSLIGGLSLLLTPLNLSLPEFMISLFYILRFFFYILLGWVALSGAVKDFKENAPKIFEYSAIGLAIFGLFQFIFLPDLATLTPEGWDPHFFRTASTFLDPNFLGAFLVLVLFPLLKNLHQANLKKEAWKPILIYIAILTTFSRSSYVMLLVTGLTLAIFKKSKQLAVVSLALFLILIFFFHIYTTLVAKPRNIDRTQSASFRISTWRQGFDIFSKSPILGIGFNSYRFAIEKYGLGSESFIQSRGATYNDSSLLSVLATTGVVGLTVYVVWLIMLIKGGLKSGSSRGMTYSAALLGLIATSFFNNTLFYPPILLWIILAQVEY